ncbi:trypsin-like serine peptidase [Candidatus Leptofilum sp.]|uniref:trypsin-like serine peptidase n=1 Tax=Candidatus Leptofilum sp. TaxID=3241576 RepID=UPI003B5B20B0
MIQKVKLGYIFVFGLLLIFSSNVMANTSSQSSRMQLQSNEEISVVSKIISQNEQQAALEFWTREAISNAEPIGLLVQYGMPDPEPLLESTESETISPVGSSPAGRALPDADLIAQVAYPHDWEGLEVSSGESNSPFRETNGEQIYVEGSEPTEVSGTSQVFSSYNINSTASLQKMYPHNWVGRLSFTTSSGTSYCSATTISGNNIVTAAHCLYDTTNDQWFSSWVFTPAYRDGNAPYGSFPASACYILTSWVNLTGSYSINSWARFDLGVCSMNSNSASQTLNQAVGWMGRQWNASYTKHFYDLGYPFKNYNDDFIPNAGLYLRTCVAESFRQAYNVRGMGCNWGGGISGGPWMVNYGINQVRGNVSGVNSGIFIGTRNIYGVRFTDNTIVPLCDAADC